jgi:hypothetical protein
MCGIVKRSHADHTILAISHVGPSRFHSPRSNGRERQFLDILARAIVTGNMVIADTHGPPWAEKKQS